MMTLQDATAATVWVFAGGLAAIVAWKLLTGGINTRGLFASANDVQLLVVTVTVALVILGEAADGTLADDATISALLLSTGSNLAYTLPRLVRLIFNMGRTP